MDPRLALFDLIGALARRRYAAGERGFAALDLNHTEARLLTLLNEGGGAVAQDTLANGLVIDRSNAGRALKRLERDGYVARRKDDADRRANVVALTAKGRKTVGAIAKLRVAIAERFFRGLDDAEAGAAVALLEKVLMDGATETSPRS